MRTFGRIKKNNKGAAMVVTIIIIAVLVVFSFTLILISYNLYASQNKNLASDRNSEAANTLSRALQEELDPANNPTKNSNLWRYLRCNIAYEGGSTEENGGWVDWPYYEAGVDHHGYEEAKRYFKLDNNSQIEGMPADVSLCIYWELPDDPARIDEQTGLPCKKTPEQVEEKRSGIILYIEINCVTGGQTYQIIDKYELEIYDASEDILLQGYIQEADVVRYNPIAHTIDKNEDWHWVHKN